MLFSVVYLAYTSGTMNNAASVDALAESTDYGSAQWRRLITRFAETTCHGNHTGDHGQARHQDRS